MQCKLLHDGRGLEILVSVCQCESLEVTDVRGCISCFCGRPDDGGGSGSIASTLLYFLKGLLGILQNNINRGICWSEPVGVCAFFEVCLYVCVFVFCKMGVCVFCEVCVGVCICVYVLCKVCPCLCVCVSFFCTVCPCVCVSCSFP